MLPRNMVVAVNLAFCALAGDWNPKAAAEYLDTRQKEWFAWPAANGNGVPCISCHTGLTYLLARPALRQALAETAPTEYETGLVKAMNSRLDRKDPKELHPKSKIAGQAAGAEVVLAALLLNSEPALDRLWPLQIKEGPSMGSWEWYSLDLDPWEGADSAYFGATLAARAVGSASASYQARPEVRDGIAALTTYLRTGQSRQPLHNRVALLWASAKLPGVLSKADRQTVLAELAAQQQPDGGWTMESLGKFGAHPNAPETAAGSNGYATAYVAFVLRQAGVAPKDKSLKRALVWLRTHQDRQTGVWTATSLNKKYPAGSQQIRFMQDAATAYAAAALAAR